VHGQHLDGVSGDLDVALVESALLLLRRGEVVSVDRLIDELWESAAPAGASGAAAYGAESRAAEREAAVRRDVGPPPWVFAGLAALCAAAALAVHRRLRQA